MTKKDKKRKQMLNELSDISFKYKEYFHWVFTMFGKGITIEIKDRKVENSLINGNCIAWDKTCLMKESNGTIDCQACEKESEEKNGI